MKNFKNIGTAALLFGFLFSSCSDEWDKHYSQKEQEVDTENLIVLDDYLLQFMRSEPDYSAQYELMEQTGVIQTMENREQVFTLLTVPNGIFDPTIDQDQVYVAQSFLTDLMFSPSNISDGQRILMWNGKYLEITIDQHGGISFNGTRVTKIIKLNDSYIYELEEMVFSPRSLIEVIENLSDEYSMFRDSVLVRNVKTFDKENSLPIGVDPTGNTVYDTVWITTNPYFAEASHKTNIFSEGINVTMLIPSNELVQASWDRAEAELAAWNFTDHHEALPDSVLKQWFFRAAFFPTKLTREDFVEDQDLTSIFGEQWRTSVQKVNHDQPIEMSNGVAYYVTELKTPKNVMIWRLKDYFRHYMRLSAEQKEQYAWYCDNLTDPDVVDKQNGAVYVGWPGVFPDIKYENLDFKIVDKTVTTPPIYEFEFQAFNMLFSPDDKVVSVEPYLIPPGEYNLFFGFDQGMKHDMEIYVNGKLHYTLTASNYNTFHYDRNGSKQPYGFIQSLATGKDKAAYRKSGGSTGKIIFEGEEAVPLVFRFVTTSLQGSGHAPTFHHWNLEPTENCY